MKSPQASGQSWLQMKLDFITQFVIKDLFTFFSPLCFCGVCVILRLAPLMAPRWLPAPSPVQQAREHQHSRKSPKTHASTLEPMHTLTESLGPKGGNVLIG